MEKIFALLKGEKGTNDGTPDFVIQHDVAFSREVYILLFLGTLIMLIKVFKKSK